MSIRILIIFIAFAASLAAQTPGRFSLLVSANYGYLSDRQWKKIEKYGSVPQAETFILVNNPSFWIGGAVHYHFSRRHSVFLETEMLYLQSERRSRPYLLDTAYNISARFVQAWNLNALPITLGYEHRMALHPRLQLFGSMGLSWYFGRGKSIQSLRFETYDFVLLENGTRRGSPGASVTLGLRQRLLENILIRCHLRYRYAFGLLIPDGGLTGEMSL